MQIVLIPSKLFPCVSTAVLKFSTITDSDRGFLVICSNTTTNAFTTLEPYATSSSRQQEKEHLLNCIPGKPYTKLDQGWPRGERCEFFLSGFSYWTVKSSPLNTQCVDVRWYILAVKRKIILDLSCCQRGLGWFSVVESEKSHSVQGQWAEVHVPSGSVHLFPYQGSNIFGLWSVYDILVHEALLLHSIIPLVFQFVPLPKRKSYAAGRDQIITCFA